MTNEKPLSSLTPEQLLEVAAWLMTKAADADIFNMGEKEAIESLAAQVRRLVGHD